MLIFVTCFVIFFVAAFFYILNDEMELVSNALVSNALAAGLLAGFFGGAVGGVAVNGIVDGIIDNHKLEHTYLLHELKDGSTTGGSLFLGSGSLHSEQVFTYYKQVGPGRYELDSVPADQTQVIESNTEQPRLEEWPEYGNWWFIAGSGEATTDYIFYVPAGSIGNTYNLDAQ